MYCKLLTFIYPVYLVGQNKTIIKIIYLLLNLISRDQNNVNYNNILLTSQFSLLIMAAVFFFFFNRDGGLELILILCYV